MPKSVKANRFNVKKIVFATITKDDATAYEYDPIEEFGKPMQIQLTPTVVTGPLYGGGVKQEDMSRVTGYELQLDVNKIPIEVRAKILGHTYAGGVLTEKASDQPKDIAVGYEVEQTGNNRELVWFYKCKARPYAQTIQQSGENFNYSTDTITIGCMPREFDEKIKEFGDTANSDFTSEMADEFLNKIPGGTLRTEQPPQTGE